MGPNGSGKTTLLKALMQIARIASSASPAEKNNPIEALLPFASSKTVGEPTRFCVEVEADWLAPGEARRLFRYEEGRLADLTWPDRGDRRLTARGGGDGSMRPARNHPR